MHRISAGRTDPVRTIAHGAVRYTSDVNDAVPLAEGVESRATGWRAELELDYERRGERTVLARRRHHGPLAVQKALYPEGDAVSQCVVVHPPGGIAGGDELAISIRVGAGAHAQLTTTGAARWYRSAGAPARQAISISVAASGRAEWLPHETIIFNGALAQCDMRVELSEDATWLGWDVFCLGRRAASESFEHGCLRQRVEVFRCGAPLWIERAVLDAGSSWLAAMAGLKGQPVFGTLLAAGERVSDELLFSGRAVRASSGEFGVTRLPGLLVARYVGDSTEAARSYLAAIWSLARPALLGRIAIAPRIWST